MKTSITATNRQVKVLLVDTLSSANDFGVELPIALDSLVDLTVFTIKGTRLRPGDCRRLIEAFPEYWGNRNKLAKLADQLLATVRLAYQIWLHRNGAVHVQFFRSMALELPLYLLMRPFLKSLVLTVHNVLPHEAKPWHRWVYRCWYRLPHKLHVLSQHTGDRLTAEFGVQPDRLLYAPHGNYARFLRDYPPADAAATRQGLGLDAKNCLVLYFGLIRPYKGVDRLIEAASLIRDPQVHVLAAGGCASEAELALRQRMADLAIGKRMELRVGHLDNQTMSNLIDAADIVVFPYHNIYQSGALLLAMTYGKAIVASDLPGFGEYLKHSHTGQLCATDNPEEFARQVEYLASRTEMRADLGKAAYRSAMQTYGWPVVAKTIATAYGV